MAILFGNKLHWFESATRVGQPLMGATIVYRTLDFFCHITQNDIYMLKILLRVYSHL